MRRAGYVQANVHRHCGNLDGNCLENSYIGDEEIREKYWVGLTATVDGPGWDWDLQNLWNLSESCIKAINDINVLIIFRLFV